ncbi:hypothetical protein [Peribacillus frigoritolerans]|nr:hypothetical protein [Peribacillus frigoritolerans]
MPIQQFGAAPDSHVRFIVSMKEDHKMKWSLYLLEIDLNAVPG